MYVEAHGDNSTISLDSCTAINNLAVGGAWCLLKRLLSLPLQDISVPVMRRYRCTGSGGGVHALTWDAKGTISLADCAFSKNTAANNGAIFLSP